MTDNTRMLLRYVCEGDTEKARTQAKIILKSMSAQKDQKFREDLLQRLEARTKFFELPYNLKEYLIAEDSASYPFSKFLLRDGDVGATNKLISHFKAADYLKSLGISYLPSLLLCGESGCGKTELARYIAYKVNLPFVYINLSTLIDSHMGSTSNRLGRIFTYIRDNACVLCLDELDAIGTTRSGRSESSEGEINRIVIGVMQELDRMPNNVIIIGTTNREDIIDPVLKRRFQQVHHVLPCSIMEAKELACKFFRSTGMCSEDWVSAWCDTHLNEAMPASKVVSLCTDAIVDDFMSKQKGQRIPTGINGDFVDVKVEPGDFPF